MKTIKLLILLSLAAVLLTLILAACGGGTAQTPSTSQNPVIPIISNPAQDIQASLIRSTSGDPTGVRLAWPSMDEANITGYHLYKSTSVITDDSRGDSSYWLPVTLNAATGHYMSDAAGSTHIPQPATAGNIVVDDVFPASIGDSFHYRLAAIDTDGDESRLSDETAVTITLFQVTELATLSAGVGDTVIINGERFGAYAEETDIVAFPGVTWVDGEGFVALNLIANILTWQPNQITVRVPRGATTGQVIVEINGLQQTTPEVFNNSDPYITELTPITGTVQDQVIVRGANFGTAQDDSHTIELGSSTVPAANYNSYADTEIVFMPAFPGTFGLHSLAVRAQDKGSNTGRFDLTNVNPVAQLSANPLTGNEPLVVVFDASGSTDAEGQVLRFDYDWNGDGTYDSLNQPDQVNRRYDTGGQFDAAVRVADPTGSTSIATVSLSINRHPVAALSATPNPALAPVNINFDASATADPETLQADLVFNYTWGDGSPVLADAGPTPPPHNYTNPGDYQASVTVVDLDGLSDTADVLVRVTGTTTIADAGSPGVSTFYQSDSNVDVTYTIAGGIEPFTVTWTLIDDNGVLPDTILAQDIQEATGTFSHNFTINTESGIPIVDCDAIPFGVWHVRADLADSTAVNDPDGTLTLPTTTGGYSVFRYSVLVVRDTVGDGLGANSGVVQPLLIDLGYSVPAVVDSDGVTLGLMENYDAVIWTGDIPPMIGRPYAWLTVNSLDIMRTHISNGGNMIILGPPGIIAIASPLFVDPVFESDYQPFTTVEWWDTPGTELFTQSFTANHSTDITSFNYNSRIGYATPATLRPGAVPQLEFTDTQTQTVAAFLPSPVPNGGNVYFGMFSMAGITAVTPSSASVGDLLDNIVAGTIEY